MPGHVAAAAEYVRRRAAESGAGERPWAGLILGTGLAVVANEVAVALEIPFGDIPGFSTSTALGHKGRLLLGTLAGAPVVVMQGRCHLYEGYTPNQVAFPVRVMAALGCSLLIVTNASGGLNPRLAQGDLLVVADHINLQWGVPTVAQSDRLPGRAERVERLPYDRELIASALAAARANGIPAIPGVYAAVAGPNYETRAELRFLRRIGADAVGMSTVPEALVGAECGLRVLALSTVTNVCRPDVRQQVTAQAVVDTSSAVAPRVAAILRAVLSEVFVERALA